MINEVLVIKALWFIIPALLGMLYAYSWRWVENVYDRNLIQYLFADKRAFLKALLVFIASCAGMLSFEYLQLLDNLHLGIAGITLGLLIPQKVEEKSKTINLGL